MQFKITSNQILVAAYGLVLAIAVFLALSCGSRSTPTPATPAPAPATVAPHVCPAPKPFNVTCPYCRNVLSVQPKETGAVIGKVAGDIKAGK